MDGPLPSTKHSMKQLITLALLTASSVLCAQPVLDATNTSLVPGPTYNVNISAFQDPGPAGAQVTWDFSGLVINATAQVNLLDPATDLLGELFPQATLITTNNLSQQAKGYQVTTAFLDNWGTFRNSGQILLLYTDPMRELVIPCSLGTSWTDTDLADFWSGNTALGSRSGSTIGTSDGFGDLIMPYGTISGVLRVRLEQSILDNTSFGVASTVGERYQYYKPGFPAPIVETIDLTTTSSGGTTVDRVIQWIDESSTGLSTLRGMDLGLAAFPNPAIGSTTVTFAASGEGLMLLTDASGRTVRSIALGELPPGIHQREMDLVGLASGPYVLRVLAESGQGALRVVVL